MCAQIKSNWQCVWYYSILSMDVVSSYLAKRRNQLGIECFEGVSEISVLTSVEMPHTKESVRGLTIFPLCIDAPFRGSAQVLVTKQVGYEA